MRLLLPVKPSEKATHIQVCVDYHEGESNPFSGEFECRGVYCVVTPVTIKEESSASVLSFTLGTGIKLRLVELTRRNKKQLKAAEAFVQAEIVKKSGKVWDCILRVCRAKGVELVEATIEAQGAGLTNHAPLL